MTAEDAAGATHVRGSCCGVRRTIPADPAWLRKALERSALEQRALVEDDEWVIGHARKARELAVRVRRLGLTYKPMAIPIATLERKHRRLLDELQDPLAAWYERRLRELADRLKVRLRRGPTALTGSAWYNSGIVEIPPPTESPPSPPGYTNSGTTPQAPRVRPVARSIIPITRLVRICPRGELVRRQAVEITDTGLGSRRRPRYREN